MRQFAIALGVIVSVVGIVGATQVTAAPALLQPANVTVQSTISGTVLQPTENGTALQQTESGLTLQP